MKLPTRLPADLKQAIRRIAAQLPWYGPWLEQGVNGGASQRETADAALARLPLVTASVLEAHYYSEDNPLSRRSGCSRYRTSGTSSGLRKSIYYTAEDEARYMRIKLDVFRAIVGDAGYKTALADVGTGHAEATAVEIFRRLGMDADSISYRLPIRDHLERLARTKPDVLYTMPSILNRILLESADPSAFGIRQVILVGEIASPAWIRQAAERLGIDPGRITDTYGSIEIGTIAYYSHAHGRYLLTEGLRAEGIRAEAVGEGLPPLESEEERVLVLTSTVREGFPAVRYVTYDVVRDLRPVRVNGVLVPSFRSIVKRIGPDLKHGEKISIYDIEEAVYRHLGDASVLVETAGNALTVRVYSPKLTDADLRAIRHDLEARIPEIGAMIAAGVLDGIEVTASTYEATYRPGVVKNKRLYRGEG